MRQPDYYTLWLMPPQRPYEDLYGYIETLAEQFKAPVFEPHITLLGGLFGHEDDILQQTSELIKILRPLKFFLDHTGFEDSRFKAAYLSCRKTEAVMQFNRQTREIFSRTSDADYRPHLSLLYAMVSENEKRQAVKSLALHLPISFEVSELRLYSTPGDDPLKRKLIYKIGF